MSTSIEDNELPRAILTRIMKQVLPEGTNIQSNAKLAMAKSTTMFINYLASAANEEALRAGHKIISAAHVLRALEPLDLEDMLPRLEEEFKAYQSIQRSRKNGAKAAAAKDKEESLTSKKRKSTEEKSSVAVKARKSSTNDNPRGGQDVLSESVEGNEEDMGDDQDAEADGEAEGDDDKDDNEVDEAEGGEGEDDEDDEDEDDNPEAGEDQAEGSLNMEEKDQEDAGKTSNLDDDDDDSDGF
ncbi:hypothetical protein BX616_011383 [Lobosporangium transversale]|uniref:DNA polymerase epsilon subunit D n=1 Tax=Lobosporangium transversale TaxID=64571 RepID=A0A1Y2GG60_9FUNG|nr:histone-fold-containing protein [Lobosporangium transversale]KAF9908714.1 hypothetical protein BX616_011383 [Lobosporangium transversale]ORZ08571.1 histone-fold-containing protein [Lobosporangium transversale]|eukprot:XP_021878499.1 histone-fold-containing protein [Lobosporangium transversale]